ncbi:MULTISPECIES: DUF2066 domain-containing protein [Spongiibacter]|uniref:DUF2066 domain-containing protein n=3 Tax=Spongiibacteraceae TaxID=1706375 RepID=UPI002353D243|nr:MULTISPECIES: DUF2066 domain-containing protein [Spongiibacter]
MRVALTRPLLLLLLLLGSLGSHADIVDNLYDVRLPVADQSRDARRTVAGQGLELVMIRVSGNRNPAESPAIVEALSSPEPFLTRFRYQRQDTEDGGSELWLDMAFSPRQVNSALQSAGLPVWSANRPPVLLWLLVDTEEGRQFVGSGAAADVEQQLRDDVRRRGLALQLPLFDLVDASNLSSDALWTLSVDQVREASQRYGSPFVLMGRATRLSSGQWLASWVLLDGDNTQRFDSEGDDASFMVGAIDRVADIQAQRYAVQTSGGGAEGSGTLVHIDGLESFADYAQMVTYLESLAVIKHANPAWMSGNELVLDLVLNGDMEKVQRFLQLDGRLRERSLDERMSNAPLPVAAYYRWQGRR